LVCYRCGDTGHFASSCRNSFFACGRLGHNSYNCRSITMVPSSFTVPSLESIEEANKYPPIIFSSNPINSDFRITLRNSLVLKDESGVGAIFIQLHLTQTFPISGWKWIVRALSDNKFLVEPPSEWKRKALFNGHIWLCGICFSIEIFHSFKNDSGREPFKVWVLIPGLPQYLWKDFEFYRIAKEFGGNSFRSRYSVCRF
jgi:Zinc knuckle